MTYKQPQLGITPDQLAKLKEIKRKKLMWARTMVTPSVIRPEAPRTAQTAMIPSLRKIGPKIFPKPSKYLRPPGPARKMPWLLIGGAGLLAVGAFMFFKKKKRR